MGAGRLSARPLRTPPDTGFSKGRGAGGGSLSLATTLFLPDSFNVRRSKFIGWTAVPFSFAEDVRGGNEATTRVELPELELLVGGTEGVAD